MSTLNTNQTLYDCLNGLNNKTQSVDNQNDASNQSKQNPNNVYFYTDDGGEVLPAKNDNDAQNQSKNNSQNVYVYPDSASDIPQAINSLKQNVNDQYQKMFTDLKNTVGQSQTDINNKYSALLDRVNKLAKYVSVPPLNLFPNYWVDYTHNDGPTWHVDVKAGQPYNLSFILANNGGHTPIRANSEWNIGDEWGDIDKSGTTVQNVNDLYNINFTPNQTGSMPIEFIFSNKAHAMANGGVNMMLKRITLTQTDHYVPYEKCDNSNQSINDITGDAGMDAKSMFGNL